VLGEFVSYLVLKLAAVICQGNSNICVCLLIINFLAYALSRSCEKREIAFVENWRPLCALLPV
jgi:hypothetical protein